MAGSKTNIDVNESTAGGAPPWPTLRIRRPSAASSDQTMMMHQQQRTNRNSSSSSVSNHHNLKYVEPLYDAFVCPLTKQVMQDPVSLENGQTFEREAIVRWLQECREKGRPPLCPVTGAELATTALRPSHALRSTIEEWTARTEASQIDNARFALAGSTPSADILSAMDDIRALCTKNRANTRRVRTAGVIPLIAAQLPGADEQLRCAALATLRLICHDDDDNKEAIAGTDTVRNCFKCLSYKFSRTKEEAIHLLAELSKHPLLSQRIAAVNGSILMLVGLSSSTSANVFIVEKAEETLSHLEDDMENVKQMAENGRLQPLLRHLVHGEESTRLEMTRYLADVALSKEGKSLVAETAAETFVKMLDSSSEGVTLAGKEAALKCVAKVSSLSENGKVLVDAGILEPVVRDLFLVASSSQLPMKVKEMCASILANIVKSGGVELASLPVDLTSEDVIHNLLHMISNTGPALEGKLLQVMVGLASSSSCVKHLVRSILSAGAIGSLIQFLEAPQAEIRLNCIKLLNLISPLMGQTLADGLRGTAGQLRVLVWILNAAGISEEQAAAASLLANLPYSDLALTRALLNEDALASVTQRVQELLYLQGASAVVGGGRFVTDFKVGLVAILCRFTFLLEDVGVRSFAQDTNLAALFTEVLRSGELDDMKRMAAVALQNLSNVSKGLSKVPEVEKEEAECCCGLFRSSSDKAKKKKGSAAEMCGVHGGVCSAKDSFCLVEAGAVVLLGCNLDHRNPQVVEACLGALASLLDPTLGVDPDGGIRILNKAGIVAAVLDIMKDHRSDVLWWRSVWMVERFLGNAEMAHVLSLDPSVHSGLVEAFRHGNVKTKQTAERALKLLNKIPSYSVYIR